jgi:hypothetical protein
MTEQYPTLSSDAPIVPIEQPETVSISDDGGRSSLRFELRRLGELIARALRAATGTTEAEELKSELREGMEALRREVDSTLESSKDATGKMRESGGPAADKVRVEVADALRALNRALDKMAAGVEPTNKPGSGAGPDTGA